MLWIWLFFRHRHQWSTGFFDRYFTFSCVHCADNIAAMVRMLGHGTGRSPQDAERRALAAAERQAHQCVLAAGCPSCGQSAPMLLEALERVGKKAARRKAWSLPIALLAILVVLGLFAGPVAADLEYSITLAIVAPAVALVVGSLIFLAVSSAPAIPLRQPYGVWFSRDPSAGPPSWFPAQPGPTPAIAAPNRLLHDLSLGTMLTAGVTAAVAIFFWSGTFRKLHVLNANADAGVLSVQIDGADVGIVGAAKSADIPYESFEVRTNAAHRVVVRSPDGSVSSYDLDPKTSRHGWVLAPHAHDRMLCLASVTWYYGTEPKENSEDGILNENAPGDRLDLAKKYDYLFTQPPKEITTKQGSETRTSLRAFDCMSLERDEMVPFSNVSHHTAGTSL